MKKVVLFIFLVTSVLASDKKLAYIVSDMSIPFWQIMARGIAQNSANLGYKLDIYDSNNSLKTELQSTIKAIKNKVDAIIISPTNSSACSTVLKFANRANIPVVIADIGCDSGEYVSYISSNNKEGAYLIGKILTKRLKELKWQNGKVGIVAIPQKRKNGQERTSGFLKALKESNIKSADLKQQVDFSLRETYRLTKEILQNNKDIKAIWLQGSDKYKGAQKAIKEFSNGEVLLLTFDAEPEFLSMIPSGELLASAMQQPFLMGEYAVSMAHNHLNGKKVVKNIQLPVLAICSENIEEKKEIINRNVLGIKDEKK
jgi:ribose transport system substrate-binding protein